MYAGSHALWLSPAASMLQRRSRQVGTGRPLSPLKDPSLSFFAAGVVAKCLP